MEDEADLREQIFHNTVRENIIFLLLFLLLYSLSYLIIRRWQRRDHVDYYCTDEDEAKVYRISLWLCTFSLSVVVCAALLLPFSIVSNEVLLHYPTSYYVKWLNHSLVQGLWNLVFLFSNVSLFILLPFAYLFTESEGFPGYRKGVMSRVYETFTVLFLLCIVVLGLTYVLSALLDKDNSSIQTLHRLSVSDLWSYYLPFLYSCISFLGVLMLLLCTPLGFARLFGVVSCFLVKPQFLQDLNEEYFIARLEEDCVRRRLEQATVSGKSYLSPSPMFSPLPQGINGDDDSIMTLQNGALQVGLSEKLAEATTRTLLLDKQRHTSSLQRNVVYPIAMMALLALSVITVLIVMQNAIELLIGIKALPLSTRQFTLGLTSLSKLGPVGATLEVILIFYLAVTSCIGLYSLPLLGRVQPKRGRTPLSHVIANCALLLILSSALPVLSRTLGITNFDLLGDFGRIEWLGNFRIVLLYNLVFAASATLCLVNKFTATVRRELYNRLKSMLSVFRQQSQRLTRAATSTPKQD